MVEVLSARIFSCRPVPARNGESDRHRETTMIRAPFVRAAALKLEAAHMNWRRFGAPRPHQPKAARQRILCFRAKLGKTLKN
jgi:hypothetical protein